MKSASTTKTSTATPSTTSPTSTQIYDGLLHNGVRPVVEISFMPKKLAFNPDALHPFWYKQNVSPPKVHGAVGRPHHRTSPSISSTAMASTKSPSGTSKSGTNPTSTSGTASPASEVLLRALRPHRPRPQIRQSSSARRRPRHRSSAMDPRLPQTHRRKQRPRRLRLNPRLCRRHRRKTCSAPTKTSPWTTASAAPSPRFADRSRHSATPHLPLFWTEWNVPGMMEVTRHHLRRPRARQHRTPVRRQRRHDVLLDLLRRLRRRRTRPHPLHRTIRPARRVGINKPSYYAYGLLHQLGDQRLANSSSNLIVTRKANGDLAIAAWNLVDPGQQGTSRDLNFRLAGVAQNAKVAIQRVDQTHGNVLPQWAAMGKPKNPSPEQAEQLNRETALPTPEQTTLRNGALHLVSPQTLWF